MEIKTGTNTSNFVVGDYTVLTSRNLIVSSEVEVAITPKMLQVLLELAQNQGETLSKEQLLIAVWGTLHTSDMVLSRAISDLRKAFSDSAKQQSYIETVSKQGYRLKQPVTWQDNPLLSTSDVVTEKTKHTNEKPESFTEKPESASESESMGVDSVMNEPAAEVSTLPDSDSDSKTGTDTDSKARASTAVKALITLGLLICCVVTYYYFTNQSQSVVKPTFTYLTASDETKRYVRVSPDGKHIAYSLGHKSRSGYQLILHSLETNQVNVLGDEQNGNTETGEIEHSIFIADYSPAFSPDSKKIAYKHFSKRGCFIRIKNLATGTHEDLADCPNAKTDALDWSADGKFLVTTVFNQTDKTEGIAIVDISDGRLDILPAPKKSATGYLWPRFSPDNKSVAVVYYQPNNHLWSIGVVNLNSRQYENRLSLNEEVSQVVWDESGDLLYYLIVSGENKGIWKLDVDTGAHTLVLETQSSSLDFDETANRFVSIERERRYGIWETQLTESGNTESKPLFKNLPQTMHPSLSPSNRSLAFISNSKGRDSLWIRNLSNNTVVLIYQEESAASLIEPRWSPDGNKILVSSVSKDKSSVIEIDFELGDSRKLASQNNVKMAKWSSNGKTLYWYEEVDGKWHVMANDIQSGEQTSLLQSDISRFEVHNEQTLYYQKIGSWRVVSKDLTSKSKNTLAIAAVCEWDVNTESLLYVPIDQGEDRFKLVEQNFESGIKNVKYPFRIQCAGDTGRQMDVSNDGQTSYYTQPAKFQTDIVLIETQK